MRPRVKSNPTPSGNAVLAKYDETRAIYKLRSDIYNPSAGGAQPITSPHGFFIDRGGSNALTERYGGFDKLFYTLVSGIVEDPDYAYKKDFKVYRRMMRDPQIYYCLEVRKTATAGLPWKISPPEQLAKDPQAIKLASGAEKRIRRIPRFTELLSNILDALLPGLSINELVWKLEEGKYVVAQHFPMSKDRFKFDREGRLLLVQPSAPTSGRYVPNYKFITHTFNVADGSWARPEEAGYVFFGKGLADTPLYHYFYFKVTALRFLLKGLERYGHPFKVFYTGAGDAQLQSRLSSILTALQNDSVVGIPGKKGETNVDIMKGAPASNIFMAFIEYVDKLITRSILMQELMTEMPSAGIGSYAAATVHASVFSRIAEVDRQLTQDTLNRTLMKFDSDLNTPGIPESIRPRFVFKHSALQDAGPFLDLVIQAVNLGIDISEAQVREMTGLREPLEGEGVINRERMNEIEMQQQAQQQQLAGEGEGETHGNGTPGRSSQGPRQVNSPGAGRRKGEGVNTAAKRAPTRSSARKTNQRLQAARS